MTFYRYDDRGWYIGILPDGISDTSRTTELEPDNKSISEEPGVLRSIYFNDRWNELPYEPTPVEQEDAMTLALKKAEKLQALGDILQIKLYEPMVIGGVTYPTYKEFRDILIGLLALEELPTGIFLFDINRMPQPVASLDQVKNISRAIAQRDTDLYNELVALSMQVSICNNSPEVEAIIWP